MSEIAWAKTEKVEDVLKVGDEVDVKLLEIDQKTGKMRLSMRALTEKPEGYVEPKKGGDRRGGNDRRGGERGGNDRRGDRNDRHGDRNDRRGDRGPRRENRPAAEEPRQSEPDIF